MTKKKSVTYFFKNRQARLLSLYSIFLLVFALSITVLVSQQQQTFRQQAQTRIPPPWDPYNKGCPRMGVKCALDPNGIPMQYDFNLCRCVPQQTSPTQGAITPTPVWNQTDCTNAGGTCQLSCSNCSCPANQPVWMGSCGGLRLCCGGGLPISPNPQPTCVPRPACLDAMPPCLPPVPPGGWCQPNSTPAPSCTPMPPQCYPGSKLGIMCPAAPPEGWCPPTITPPATVTPPQGCYYVQNKYCTRPCPLTNPYCCPPALVCPSGTSNPTVSPVSPPLPPVDCAPQGTCWFGLGCPAGTTCKGGWLRGKCHPQACVNPMPITLPPVTNAVSGSDNCGGIKVFGMSIPFFGISARGNCNQ